ncbi:hypothetical protein [Streptomyces pinistramenti]|uniref:hypothetical protein n=1 Tax=Streptomyces pinistramenti TaxID=2884812 RepID=UPI001D0627B1|nr:hypothetical protein [Streptomyces pinistramenti]MCB5906069.1 hypothetical protein [Streptomyces pinistramenti]
MSNDLLDAFDLDVREVVAEAAEPANNLVTVHPSGYWGSDCCTACMAPGARGC